MTLFMNTPCLGSGACRADVSVSDLTLVRVLGGLLRVAGTFLQLAFHLLCAALDLLAGAAGCLSDLALHLAGDILDGSLDLVLVHGTLHRNGRSCPQATYHVHSRFSNSFGPLKVL